MVIQVNDTPKNREAMKRMYESARSIVGPVDGNLGVMKLETVTLESWARSRPIPLENDLAEARRNGAPLPEKTSPPLPPATGSLS